MRGAQALLAHEPPDPVLAAALPEFTQIGAHTQRPVGFATALEARGDERAQGGIALAAGPPGLAAVRVKAAFADLERVGQRARRKLMTEFFHHRETLAGTSADKMPNAFFKMSRCWRR